MNFFLVITSIEDASKALRNSLMEGEQLYQISSSEIVTLIGTKGPFTNPF